MDRGPRFLSIFASLDAVFGKNMFLDMLLKYNTLIMILAIIIAFVICVRNKVNWINSLVVGYLTMLTFYKVGHPQYYVPLLFMVFASWIFSERKFDKFAFCYIPLAIFLSLYQISFFYHTSYSSLLWVGQYGGFFAFALALGSIFYSLRGNLSRS
jgi:hypothetical protein